MDRVIRDGKVAVVYSPGFGSGWGSTNPDSPEIIFDPYIVACVESRDWDRLRVYMELKFPDLYVSKFGLDDLDIAWLPVGTEFIIHEYDGNETIQLRNSFKWLIA